VERIDVGGEFPVVVFDDEMAWKSDAGNRLAQPPGHFDVDHRECDRKTGPPIQNIIEATVARIVVVDFVAVEAELFEEISVGGVHKLAAGGFGRQARCDPGGYAIEDRQEGLRVEIGHLD
jgi:hypothetical protein